MKILLGFLCVFLVFGAGAAHADIDQLCLKRCVGNGASGSACLSKCSYGMDSDASSASAQAAGGKGNNAGAAAGHNVFMPLIPAGNQLMPAGKRQPVSQQDENYACLAPCLKTGELYAACEAGCARKTCQPGADLCNTPPADPRAQAGQSQTTQTQALSRAVAPVTQPYLDRP